MSNELLDLARSDPPAALKEVTRLLPEAKGKPSELSVLYRARGQAAMVIADYSLAAKAYKASFETAIESGQTKLANRIAISMAGAYFDLGEPDRAYAILDDVDQEATGELLGISLGQRAGLLVDQGRLEEALNNFEKSMPHLEGGEDQFHLANSYQNLGILHLDSGNPKKSAVYFQKALAIFEELEMPVKSAGIQHNIAQVAGQLGDLVGAIEAFDESERLYRYEAGGRSHHGADKCEVLLQAGLLEEAIAESDRLKEYASRKADPRQLGYAHYLAAIAHSLSGDKSLSIVEAKQAALIFEDNISSLLAGLAKLVELECLSPDPRLGIVALRLAESFAENGDLANEISAIATSTRHSTQLRAAQADRLTQGRSDGRSQVRQASLLGLARINLTRNPPHAIKYLEEALTDISHQVGLQSSPRVRQSMATHLSEIQQLGLSALTSLSDASRLAQWIDATRMVSSTLPPLRPVIDSELATLLADLRSAQSFEGHDPLAVARIEAKLMSRSIHSSNHLVDQIKPLGGEPNIELEPGIVISRLYELDKTLFRIDTTNRSSQVFEIGPLSIIESEISFLTSDLRSLARDSNDSGLAGLIRTASTQLRAKLLPDTNDQLVVCPPPSFLSFPWSLLANQGQSLTVAPTINYWSRPVIEQTGSPQIVAIAGPGLTHADNEVEALSQTRPNLTTLLGAEATVSATLSALENSELVHLACHGTHHRSSPRFSALQLVDGHLFAYDIEQLAQTAKTVVLTACNSGVEKALAGEEAIGLGTALLRRGTRTVIAGTSLIDDSELLVRFSTELHSHLTAGSPPAKALAKARETAGGNEISYLHLCAFTCLGWG